MSPHSQTQFGLLLLLRLFLFNTNKQNKCNIWTYTISLLHIVKAILTPLQSDPNSLFVSDNTNQHHFDGNHTRFVIFNRIEWLLN